MSRFNVEQIKRDILTGQDIPEECNCDYCPETGASYCIHCIARAWKAEAEDLRTRLAATERSEGRNPCQSCEGEGETYRSGMFESGPVICHHCEGTGEEPPALIVAAVNAYDGGAETACPYCDDYEELTERLRDMLAIADREHLGADDPAEIEAQAVTLARRALDAATVRIRKHAIAARSAEPGAEVAALRERVAVLEAALRRFQLKCERRGLPCSINYDGKCKGCQATFALAMGAA